MTWRRIGDKPLSKLKLTQTCGALLWVWECYTQTETSFWRHFLHCLHRKLSYWQLTVEAVTKISSKWHSYFIVLSHVIWIPARVHRVVKGIRSVFHWAYRLWFCPPAVSSTVELSSYPGYFSEYPWLSLGLPEISRVILTGVISSQTCSCFIWFPGASVKLFTQYIPWNMHTILLWFVLLWLNDPLWPLLLTWFNFNPGMDK